MNEYLSTWRVKIDLTGETRKTEHEVVLKTAYDAMVGNALELKARLDNANELFALQHRVVDEMFAFAVRYSSSLRAEWGGENILRISDAARDDQRIRDLIHSAGQKRISDETVNAYREYLIGLRCSSKCPVCGLDTPHTHATHASGGG